MNRLMIPIFTLLCVAGGLASEAAPLRIVSVAAPNINCIFDTDCRVTVSDFVDTFSVPAASGEGRAQSRTLPPGEPGTPGEGLYAYEYRIDLTPVGAITARICVQSLTFDFGPIEPLDYDGDGRPEHVYVVTRGGLGSVAPSAVEQSGATVTFTFDPGVCPGNRPGAGESSFFFGLASRKPPRDVEATVGLTLSGDLTVSVRAPEPAEEEPRRTTFCEVVPPFPPLVIPIDPTTPACRCFQDVGLRVETHCAFLNPDLFVVWRVPFPMPPAEPFQVQWVLVPTTEIGAAARIAVKPPPGFLHLGRGRKPSPPDQEGRAVDKVWMVASEKSGSYRAGWKLTLPPVEPGEAPATLEVWFPVEVGERP